MEKWLRRIWERLNKQFEYDFGCNGSVYRVNGDGTTTAGDIYYAITAAADSTTITYTETVSGDAQTAVALAAGTTIYGRFDEILVDTGAVVIYPV